MEHLNKYQKYKNKYLKLKKKQYHGKNIKDNKINKIQEVEEEIKPDYVETISEPWFTLISMGIKTIEGRLNRGTFRKMKIGDIVEWTNNDFYPRSVLTKITGIEDYNTLFEYLHIEDVNKCLPGIKNLDNGLSVVYKNFTQEDKKNEEEFGVIAIIFKLL